jgi:hypothetical protein
MPGGIRKMTRESRHPQARIEQCRDIRSKSKRCILLIYLLQKMVVRCREGIGHLSCSGVPGWEVFAIDGR